MTLNFILCFHTLFILSWHYIKLRVNCNLPFSNKPSDDGFTRSLIGNLVESFSDRAFSTNLGEIYGVGLIKVMKSMSQAKKILITIKSSSSNLKKPNPHNDAKNFNDQWFYKYMHSTK